MADIDPREELAALRRLAELEAKAQPSAPPANSPIATVAEPVMAIGSGMVAKPLGDVIGLGALGSEGLRRMGVPLPELDPRGIQQGVQNALTYQPRTQAGQFINEYNPLALLGKGVNWLAGKAEGAVAPPQTSGPLQAALGYGVHEAVNQLPMLLGAAPSMAPMMEGAARSWMMKALKPPTGTPKARAEAQAAVDAAIGLDPALGGRGFNITKGGMEDLRDRAASFNHEIENIIQPSTKTIDRNAVGARTALSQNEFSYSDNALANIAAIKDVSNNFLDPKHPLMGNSQTIPIQDAQRMKQQIYKEIGDSAYGAQGETYPATTSARKNIAMGLKEGIAASEPAVGPANAALSSIYDALPLVERRVFTHVKQDPGGFVAWMVHSPAKAAAFMASRSDLFKSLLARTFAEASKGEPVARPIAGAAITGEANAQ